MVSKSNRWCIILLCSVSPRRCNVTLNVCFLCIGIVSLSQRNYVNTAIWNEPLPLTLVGTPADPNHSSNLPVVMDPLMFLAGAATTSLNAYPAAAAAATAIMPPASELLGGDGAEVGAVGGFAGPGMGAGTQAGSRLSTASSSAASGDRDYETSTRPSMLRLLQTQNVSLSRVSKALSNAAHALEVSCQLTPQNNAYHADESPSRFSQVLVNALSFADSRASIVAYAFLSAVACFLSVGLYVMVCQSPAFRSNSSLAFLYQWTVSFSSSRSHARALLC